MKKKVIVDKNTYDRMTEIIKVFFKSERNEEIGDLSAKIYFEYILENIGPHLYNQGVKDCIAQMHDKVEDLYGCEI